MSWVTIIWSMIASVSFTLATIYLLIWFRERRSWAYLCFFVLAVGVIGMATGEMAAMYAKSPAEYGAAIRWGHFAYGFIAVGSLGFVHFYFGTGKVWLLGAALGLRMLAVVANFTTGLNLHIRAIQSLQQVNFLGEPVSMLGVWTLNPWVRLGQFAALVQFIYVADASFRLWRTGSRESRRQAVIVGGSLAFFILFSSAQAGLVAAGVLRMPIVVSFPFLAVLLSMGYELSRDALRAAQLGRELRESEQQMAMATEVANLGVWDRDLVRNEISANAKWRALLGFTPAERLDLEKFLQRLHPDDHESFRQAVAKATGGDGRYEAEFRVVLPDGRMRWINSRGRVEFDGGGKPVRIRGISVDITDRKRTEEASRNAHDLMAAVFNSVPGLLYLYTEDGRLVQWNRQHEEMTGYTFEELLNYRIEDWFDEEDRLKLAREFPKVFSEGYTQVELNLILKNRQKMPVFATGSKVIIDGKPHLVGIAIDISVRKKAEELLRESEERMTLAAEAANLGVWVRDLARNTIWASDQWRALFGFSPAERLDLEMLLQRIHPDDRDAIRLAMARANDGDGQYEVEFRVVLPDGRMRWVVSRGQVEFNGGGKPVRVRGVSMDITKRQTAAGKPFFVWVNFTHMHFRTHVKPESVGQSGQFQDEYHDAMIDHDKNVGTVLKALDDLGIADNTLVMYSTDNGPHMNSWPDAAMTPFRSEKNSNWEGAYRVPCMIKWPGHIPAGTINNDIISHLDMMPTILAAAGVPDVKEQLLKGMQVGDKTFKVHLDGYNQLPLLTGETKVDPRKEFFYFNDDAELVALRYDNWKIVFMEQQAPGTMAIWATPFVTLRIPKLFNLRTDPYERADITSNTYYDWFLNHAFVLVPAQVKVGEFLSTFKEFPPSQKAGSFSLKDVMDKMSEGATGGTD